MEFSKREHFLFRLKVKDISHPWVNIIWRGIKSWTKGASTPGRPPLFNGRWGRNAFLLDETHHLLNELQILHIWFLNSASWKTCLRNPLLTTTIKAQNLVTPTHPDALTLLPVLWFHLINLYNETHQEYCQQDRTCNGMQISKLMFNAALIQPNATIRALTLLTWAALRGSNPRTLSRSSVNDKEFSSSSERCPRGSLLPPPVPPHIPDSTWAVFGSCSPCDSGSCDFGLSDGNKLHVKLKVGP